MTSAHSAQSKSRSADINTPLWKIDFDPTPYPRTYLSVTLHTEDLDDADACEAIVGTAGIGGNR